MKSSQKNNNGKYKIEQFPKNKDFDLTKLNEYQIEIRNNQKKYYYGKEMTCNKCYKKQPIDEFYISNKVTGRRQLYCRDCQMKGMGVVEIGKQRFANKIIEKGFRRCSVCKEIKPLTEYTKSISGYKGYANNCYSCSNKLRAKYVKEQREKVGIFYIKQYGKRKGISNFTNENIDKLRKEIERKRDAKYFVDNKKFVTLSDFARYIERQYGVPFTTTEKRISQGKTEEECKLSKAEMRSKAHSKGKIKVTDTVTKQVFYFKNTNDTSLIKMFSKSTIISSIRSGRPTRITKLSKYKNPCIIERI